jgi:hypothetical protein
LYGYICNKSFTLNLLHSKLLIAFSMKIQGVKCVKTACFGKKTLTYLGFWNVFRAKVHLQQPAGSRGWKQIAFGTLSLSDLGGFCRTATQSRDTVGRTLRWAVVDREVKRSFQLKNLAFDGDRHRLGAICGAEFCEDIGNMTNPRSSLMSVTVAVRSTGES